MTLAYYQAGMGKTYRLLLAPTFLTFLTGVAAFLAAFSTATPSEVSVVKALAGEIPITGRLPVTIPNFAQYGDGIQLPAKIRSAPSVN